MNNVRDGLIVELAEQYHTPALGCIGAFRRTVKFPGDLPTQITGVVRDKPVDSHHEAFMPYLADMHTSDKLILKVNRDKLHPDIELKEGMVFEASNYAPKFKGKISKIHEDYVEMDCNLLLAGLPNVWINLYVIDVREPTEEERGQEINRLELLR